MDVSIKITVMRKICIYGGIVISLIILSGCSQPKAPISVQEPKASVQSSSEQKDSIFAVDLYKRFFNLEKEISQTSSKKVSIDTSRRKREVRIELDPKDLPYYMITMYQFVENLDESDFEENLSEGTELIKYEKGEKLFLYLTFYPNLYKFSSDSLYVPKWGPVFAFRANLIYGGNDFGYGYSINPYSNNHPWDYIFGGGNKERLIAAYEDFYEKL